MALLELLVRLLRLLLSREHKSIYLRRKINTKLPLGLNISILFNVLS